MINIQRSNIRMTPDSKRVVARYFVPGGKERAVLIINNILELPPEENKRYLQHVLTRFSGRHRSITKLLNSHCEKIFQDTEFSPALTLSQEQKLLIGAFFTMEYSIESAAFFNPSIVENPDQYGVMEGEKKVIISFRAVGEGHISSLVFREGIIDKNNQLTLMPPRNNIVDLPDTIQRFVYEKDKFIQKMKEMKLSERINSLISDALPEKFNYGELRKHLEQCAAVTDNSAIDKESISQVMWLAKSHYELSFSMDSPVSERVIFPVSYREQKGIEDVRFVRFSDNDGNIKFYGTYTAYDGTAILPKIIETEDFYRFAISPLHGLTVQNKGMALFPRLINGRYAMLARIDGRNNYLMMSNDIHVWPEKAVMVHSPVYPWEFIQVGNCGSPIETRKGWLVLTHGVGPMRQYCLGAVLLDLKNPAKLIGRLKEPLMIPNEEEREGYVPNVVYSCGGMLHGDSIVLPYALSDYCSSFAVIPLNPLLDELV